MEPRVETGEEENLQRRTTYFSRLRNRKIILDMRQMLGLAAVWLVSATVSGLHLQAPILGSSPPLVWYPVYQASVPGYGLMLARPELISRTYIPRVTTRGLVTADINNKAR